LPPGEGFQRLAKVGAPIHKIAKQTDIVEDNIVEANLCLINADAADERVHKTISYSKFFSVTDSTDDGAKLA
jgi:hypothetical protein